MTKARRGLNMLLRNYPDADVCDVWNQSSAIVEARERLKDTPYFDDVSQFFRSRNSGPWTCVDLLIDGKVKRFAVWNETGYVYRLGEDGVVEDDPFLKIRD
jgi:hypothetical protein